MRHWYGNTCISIPIFLKNNISYDKKGNIVLTANILNNTQYMATMIKKINIQVKTLDGKTICSYTVKNKKITLKSGGKKYVKYTIAKKNV